MVNRSSLVFPERMLMVRISLFGLCGVILGLISQYNFLLFHTIVELISIVIGFSTFIFIWNSRDHVEKSFYIIIGISFLFISVLDFAHTITYRGMGIFSDLDANPATQFWIAARMLQAISCLIALLCVMRTDTVRYMIIAYSVVTIIILLLVAVGLFPDCYIMGQGLTRIKIWSEYLIIGVMIISCGVLIRKRQEFLPELFNLTLLAFICMIAAETCFSLYQDIYGYLNMAGHLMKVVAYYLIYLSIIHVGLYRPRLLLHTRLEEALAKTYIQATTDMLTRVSSRRHFYEQFNHEFDRSVRYAHPLSVMMVDIDDFKRINDTWGHLTGDTVLAHIAQIMKQQLRTVDLIGRFGGEEFVLALPETTVEQAGIVAERIRTKIEAYRFESRPSGSNSEFRLTVSIGIGQQTERTRHPDDLIDCADKAMYQAKRSGKNTVVTHAFCDEEFSPHRTSFPDLE